MRTNRKMPTKAGVEDYRHDDRHPKEQPTRGHCLTCESPRKAEAGIRLQPPPAPSLRFDENSTADQLPELLQKAQQGPLSADEVQTLAEAGIEKP